jgi:hypothetical protein
MSTYHHAHPHAHRRGVHEHRHGHRGRPGATRDVAPWTHWFGMHRHIHPDATDEARLTLPEAPGEGRDR